MGISSTKSKTALLIILAGVLLLFPCQPVQAQTSSEPQNQASSIEELKKTAVKVYIDCSFCDLDYIKTEITFVNYVRDRKEAHVHILVTTLSTGGGGREYTLTFLGQNEYDGVNDVQKYFTSKTDTAEEIRKGLVKALKLGLLSYVARTPISQHVKVSYQPPAITKEVKDRWNFWVFSLNLSGSFNGEEAYKYRSGDLSFSANRVTEALKIRLNFSYDSSRSDYKFEDQTITGRRHSWDSSGLIVASLSEHWSAGVLLEGESSTYRNIDLSFQVFPAIEFNAFPYSQSTRRQLRFLYRAGIIPVRYREETIYFKTRETLWRQSLSVSLDLREKWGTVSTSVSGSNYFHDFSKNNLNMFGIISLNIVKGLSAYVIGSWSIIHDQLALPRGGLSYEDVLLRQKEMATTYSYFVSVGLQFSFGSIFTNVINPRFGRLSGSSMSIRIN